MAWLTCSTLFSATFGKPRIATKKTARTREVVAKSGKASTRRSARNDAIAAIPLTSLRPEFQRSIAGVVEKPSLYRRLPVETIDCDPSMYVFLIRHPEVVVNIWQLMGITQIQLQRTGPFSYEGTDGQGTQSRFELVYGSDEKHLIFGEGTYDGPLLPKPIRGRCVLLLRTGYAGPTRSQVTSKLDVFVQFDNAAADVIAKTVHPLLGRMADVNFRQSVGFLGRISRTSQRNPTGMQRLAGRLSDVDPVIRKKFSNVVRQFEEIRNESVTAGKSSIRTRS